MFTLNNHLTYTIGNRLFGSRENSFEKFNVNVGKIDVDHYKRSSYINELRRTAEDIVKNYGNDIIVFLSGGTDSDIVLRSFLDIGVKPRCVTVSFKDNYNIADVRAAQELAASLGVKHGVMQFDVKNFVNSGEASEFGKKLQCSQVTYLIIYYHILKVGLPAVMGGELMLKRDISKENSEWYYCFRENEDASAMRFTNTYNIPLVNEFFSYTPELMLYYLEDPEIVELVSNKYNYKLSSVSSKNKILRRLFPAAQPRKKTHGFENLLGFNFESYRLLAKDQIARLESSLDGIYYNDVVNMLRGKT